MSVCGTGDINQHLNKKKGGREHSGGILVKTFRAKKGQPWWCDLAHSVKSVALDFSPFGAIKGGNAQFPICQILLRNVAVEDSFEPQCSRHGDIIQTQITCGRNTEDGGFSATELFLTGQARWFLLGWVKTSYLLTGSEVKSRSCLPELHRDPAHCDLVEHSKRDKAAQKLHPSDSNPTVQICLAFRQQQDTKSE